MQSSQINNIRRSENMRPRTQLRTQLSTQLSTQTRVTHSREIAALALVLAMACLFSSLNVQAAVTGRQALTTSVLRVCADPSNLPFSNEALEGFENKIITALADHLNLEVRYTWFPQSIGFVRNTLRLRECDLISGITTTSELVQNTNPYYHSIYTMIYRTESDISATSISDPQLKNKKLGVVAGTPPANILAQLGLLKEVKPYHLITDTRRDTPAKEAVLDVGLGKTDVAFVWGPIAAFYAKQSSEALTLVPLVLDAKRTRLSFRVSMAVRYNETDWKHSINEAIASIQPVIDDILRDYGVPLLNERGELYE